MASISESAEPELCYEEDRGPFSDTAQEFVRREVSGSLEQWRTDSTLPGEFFRKAGETGLLGVLIPREFGGFGLRDRRFGQLSTGAVVESGAFGLAWTLGLHSEVSAPTLASFHHGAGHEALLRDAAGGRRLIAVAGLSGGVQMTRDAGRWRLDGVAHAVPGAPVADHFLVLGTAAGGGPLVAAVPSARVAIEKSATLLGASDTGSGEVIFDGVELEEDSLLGAGAAERLVTAAALLVGGIAVAAARFCIDQAVAYVNERSVFGRPVALFGNTREQIAAVQSELLTASGYHSTLLSVPADHTVDKAQCFALARTAVSVFEKCADLGLQLHGGYGYMREYPISHAYAAAHYFRLAVDALPGVIETVARDAGLVENPGDTRVGR